MLAAALPGWLAAHQVPVAIFGLELGMLPLLPTIGVVAITAKAAAGAAERLDLYRPGQAGQVVGAIAVAHGGRGLVVAAALSPATTVTADPLAALYYPALVAALAADHRCRCGRCGLLDAIAERADAVALSPGCGPGCARGGAAAHRRRGGARRSGC